MSLWDEMRSDDPEVANRAGRIIGSRAVYVLLHLVALGWWLWPAGLPSCSDSLDVVEDLVRQTLRENAELRMSFPAEILAEFIDQPYGFEAVRQLSEGEGGTRTCSAQVLMRKINVSGFDSLLPQPERFEAVEWEVYLTEDDEVYVQIL